MEGKIFDLVKNFGIYENLFRFSYTQRPSFVFVGVGKCSSRDLGGR